MTRTAILRDVREIIDNSRILEALLRCLTSKREVTADDLEVVLGMTIRRVCETVFAQAITIFMVEPDSGDIAFKNIYYSRSLWQGDELRQMIYEQKAESLLNTVVPQGRGIVGRCVATGKTQFIPDARSDPDFYGQIDEATGFVTRSVIAVPLIVSQKAIGAIQVLNKDIDGVIYQFSDEDVFLLEEVANYSARIIQKAHYPQTPFTERERASFIARHLRCDYVEITDDFPVDEELIKRVGEESLRRYLILPLKLLRAEPPEIRVAMANPLDFQKIGDFELVTKLKIVEKTVAAESDIHSLLERLFPPRAKFSAAVMAALEQYREEAPAAEEAEEYGEDSAKIVKLSHEIIEKAYLQGASDIHIEPQEDYLRVRYRVDGACHEVLQMPRAAARSLVSRLKIMANLDIAEHRLPQDGRIAFKRFNRKHDFDLRVSIAPMGHGEKVVMRILDKTKSALPLDKLGFSAYNLQRYRQLISAPYGMILHTGPTGSGKSMTLFSALGEINTPDLNISTAEDPIEYTIAGINQMQIRSDIGLTFAHALRCFLRQDPDIILVGEIRDLETAEIAVEAALTGHLLFSTVHTNDAPTTISRFMELGIEPFMISSSIICICAQRLLRRVCQKCATESDPTPEELPYLKMARDGAPVGKIKRATTTKSCRHCEGIGYKGRIGTHEILVPDEKIREMINQRASAEQIRLQAIREAGMRTLFMDLMEKTKQGIVTLEEAFATARPTTEED